MLIALLAEYILNAGIVGINYLLKYYSIAGGKLIDVKINLQRVGLS